MSRSNMEPPLLFTPGPTWVRPEVLAEMSRQAISHRGVKAQAVIGEVAGLFGRILGSSQQILLSTSSATGLMEAAVRNCVRRRCLCLSCGAFGKRWMEIVESCGKTAIGLEVEWGRAIRPEAVAEALERGDVDAVTLVHNETSTGVANPLREISEVVGRYPEVLLLVDVVSSLGGMPVAVDELGTDVCLAGVQKALALPAGFSLCSVSEAALERSRSMAEKGFYFDFVRMQEAARKSQSLTTPSTAHLFAIRKQLQFLCSEGLGARHRRHRQMAQRVREWARERMELYAEPGFESDTVTCIRTNDAMDATDFCGALESEGFRIAPGYGKLKKQTFRIGHMGDHSLQTVESLLEAADRILIGKKGNPR